MTAVRAARPDLRCAQTCESTVRVTSADRTLEVGIIVFRQEEAWTGWGASSAGTQPVRAQRDTRTQFDREQTGSGGFRRQAVPIDCRPSTGEARISDVGGRKPYAAVGCWQRLPVTRSAAGHPC